MAVLYKFAWCMRYLGWLLAAGSALAFVRGNGALGKQLFFYMINVWGTGLLGMLAWGIALWVMKKRQTE